MLFTSYSFIAFILILFPVYYLIPKKWQWSFLLLASLFFYYQADPRYLIFIGVTSLTVWLSSLWMEKIANEQDSYIKAHKAEMTKEEKKKYKDSMKAKKKWIMLAFLLLNLGILAFTKYTNFVISTINDFRNSTAQLKTIELIIPMGISFYTFQTLSYLIDCYRGTIKAEKNFFKFALFASFFPQLVQGPISRFKDLSATLYTPHKFELRTFEFGVMRILWGYFKKVVIADRIITGVTTLVGQTENYSGAYVFVAMMFYAFELYCDFTGGIDITIGIAQALGIKVTENFNLPYFSKSIKEYWNRWHITMGSWFTDYIFYPLSVSPKMLKLSKWSRQHLGNAIGKRISVYIACFLVWFATGIWHGAAWNFIVWGLMNFVVIMISQELEPLYSKFHAKFNLKVKAGWKVFQIVRTIFLMSMIRMFDCYRDVPMTFKMVGTMFTKFNAKIFVDGSLLNIGLSSADYIILTIGFVVVFTVSLIKALHGERDVREDMYDKIAIWYCAMALLLIATVLFGAYGVGYDSAQFIYNQF